MLYFFSIIGSVNQPSVLSRFGNVETGGIGIFLNLILNILVVGGGVFSLFNFVLAGYAFLSAGDDPKKIQGAWAKIWQSVLGLVFIAGSFVLAAIFGWLIFGDYDALLRPVIPTV